MRAPFVAICLTAGVAACATPGQVRRVETAVTVADHERARSDSAQRSELARIQIMMRANADSMNLLFRQLNDADQRMSRENASNFDDIRQRLYQVVAQQSTVAQGVSKLRNQVDAAVMTTPVASDTTGRGSAPGTVPSAELLIAQARDAINQTAYPSARRSLNLVLTSYPQSPQIADALYWLGYSYESESPDSSRTYYNRVWKEYPKADKASVALYKLGNLELKAGNVPQARVYWQQIVSDYKQSPEFEPARDRLRENP